VKQKLIIAGVTFILTALFAAHVSAQDWGSAWGSQTKLSYIDHSTKKVEQITANCDWIIWDATIDFGPPISNPDPTCKPTVSQTVTRADVLGQGLGYSFEHKGKLIFLFGDTFGANVGHGNGNAYFPTWTSVQNTFQYLAGDTMAWSSARRPKDGLLINYFLTSDQSHALLVQPMYATPQCFPDGTCGTALPMGADDIPNSGISLDGQIYIIASSGSVVTSSGGDYSKNYSVVSKFDENAGTFSAGRTISSVADGGHFVYLSLRELPRDAYGWDPFFGEPFVAVFGVGEYGKSNIYLSLVPRRNFESGAGTLYFTGLDPSGFPSWGPDDGASDVPVVSDLDPNHPTITNLSAVYSRELGLWLMTFGGGRQPGPQRVNTAGVYFTYAKEPWGPWATPQLILNDCRDNAYGNYIFYYAKAAQDNDCPAALPGVTTFPASAGPAGPTIGPQDPVTGNDPATTRGGGFAPEMIERFIEVQGDTLKIYYTLSTWNPYTVLKMESDFTITRGDPY